MNISNHDRRLFDSLMEVCKENEMISFIISTLLHSVVIAHPVEESQDNNDVKSDTNQDNKHDNEAKENVSVQESCTDDQLSKEPVQVVSDDKYEYLNDAKSEQRFCQQVDVSSVHDHLSVDAFSYHSPTSAVPQEKFEQKKNEDIDMKEFIKQIVRKKYGKVPELQFFDAAVVYDERDFNEAVKFRDQIMSVLKPQFGDDLRIELFDSESFAQSKIMVVKDVIDRCSVVLLYLTPNFDSPELNLFVEESIAITRLGYNKPKSGLLDHQSKWVLKPVQTEPLHNRRYSVPMGLSSLKGINWYDKSSYTLHQIETIFKDAINVRKQREASKSSDFAYEKTFGNKIETPFEQTEVPDFLTVTMPPEEPYQQLMPGAYLFSESNNPVNYQGMQMHQSSPVADYGNRFYQNENVHISSEFQPHPGLGHRFPAREPQTSNVDRTLLGPTHGHNFTHGDIQRSEDIQRQYTRREIPQRHHNIAERSGYDVAQLHELNVAPQAAPHVRYNNNSVPVYDTEPSLGDVHHHHNFYQGQYQRSHSNQHHREHLGLGNSTDEGFTNLPYDLLPSTSELSTDDVEIDNYVDADEQQSETRVPNKRIVNRHQRDMKTSSLDQLVESDTDDSESDSYYSDDSDGEFNSKGSKHKIINIQGCSIVQLGKGNLVSQQRAPVSMATEKSSHVPEVKSRTETSSRLSTVKTRHGTDAGDINSDANIKVKHTDNQHLNISPLDCQLNILSDEENKLSESNLVRGSNNLTGNLLNAKQELPVKSTERTTSKINPVLLNVVIDSDKSDSDETEYQSPLNLSPDCNISEDDMFASGPLEDLDIHKDHSDASNAPFAFSQTRLPVNIFKHVPQTFTTTNVNAECDNSSDLD
ncbi:hypothetical protein ACF0H5_013817 [Mactra antiquata]